MRNNVPMGEGADEIGTIATGALLAREVERAHAGAPPVGHSDTEPCANCGTTRVGAYCHECGQVGHVHRNLGALVHDIAHGVFHFEGKVWKTLPLLAIRPGELTRRYVAGERAKFVSPMAMFLFSVFLMFAVVSNVGGSGKSVTVAKQGAASELATAAAKLERAELRRTKADDADDIKDADERIATLKTKIAALQAVAHQSIGKPVQVEPEASHLDPANPVLKIPIVGGIVRHAAENPELVVYKMKSYAYKYSWALIPISLPFIWLLFAFRRDVGLYDHAIFAIYSLSFMSLGVVTLVLGSRIGVPTAIVTLAAIIIPPVHIYKQLKGAYGLGRFGAVWRTSVLLIMTSITLSLFASFVLYLGSD
jgi:hypothetical protein